MKNCERGIKNGERGSVLIVVTVLTVLIVGIVYSYLAISMKHAEERNYYEDRIAALHAADSGLEQAFRNIQADTTNSVLSNNSGVLPATTTGDNRASFTTNVATNGNTKTITSTSTAANVTRTLEMVVQHQTTHTLFNYAIFSGGTSAGSNSGYELKFGGNDEDDSKQADQVTGKVYSNEDIRLTGDAVIDGDVEVIGKVKYGDNDGEDDKVDDDKDKGDDDKDKVDDDKDKGGDDKDKVDDDKDKGGDGDKVEGGDGDDDGDKVEGGGGDGGDNDTDTAHITGTVTEGCTPVTSPNLKLMKYKDNADVDVKCELDTNGSSETWENGGTATQVPQSNAAHIFRRNPDDRNANTDADDYYLEDPYNGGASELALNDGDDNKIFYIEGNLWLNNQNTTEFYVNNAAGEGAKITIVVKGNIYIENSFAYKDANAALLLVALADGESYTDENNNGVYDSGETILNDDGDGLYTGPKEGAGNIIFGNNSSEENVDDNQDKEDDNKDKVDDNDKGDDDKVDDNDKGDDDNKDKGDDNDKGDDDNKDKGDDGNDEGSIKGELDSFMYAENNVSGNIAYEGDLSEVVVTGNIAAGNLINIERDYGDQHTKLTVIHDTRIANSDITLKGTPTIEGAGNGAWIVLSRREL